MKLYSPENLLKNSIKRFKWLRMGGACLISALVLTGCAKAPAPIYSTVSNLSSMSSLQPYETNIKNAGGQIIKLGETVRIIMPDQNLFNDNSANIPNLESPLLDAVTAYIACYKIETIKVSAYSDRSSGAVIHNRLHQLTTAQAQAVQNYLWENGIHTRVIVAEGLGSHDPVATNTTAVGRSFNRRVEIVFHFYPHYIRYM